MNLLILAQETTTSDPWVVWALAPVGAIVALLMAFAFQQKRNGSKRGRCRHD